jgi:probable F420-dependent oxidoreductase
VDVNEPAIDLGRVGIWTSTLDRVASNDAQRAAAALEELGFPTLWIPEGLGRDPFVTATLLLGATSTIKVATGVANIYARDAVTMANTQRALEEAFPGRFVLGLGVSHLRLVSGERHHDYSKPYSKMVQYLDEMDAASFSGFGPRDRPPCVLAALGPRMLQLAAERAAGAHPYFTPVEHTAVAREILGPARVLAPEQMVVLDTDRARAFAIARRRMAMYLRSPNYLNNLRSFGFGDDDFADGGSDRIVDAIVAWGGVEAALRRVQDHLDAGATHVCVQALGEDPDAPPGGAWSELAAALHDTRG